MFWTGDVHPEKIRETFIRRGIKVCEKVLRSRQAAARPRLAGMSRQTPACRQAPPDPGLPAGPRLA